MLRTIISALLAALVLLCSHVASAQSANSSTGHSSSFDDERQQNWWVITGNAGFDGNFQQSHRGRGNAWIRATTGWNALSWGSATPLGSTKLNCRFEAWVRGTANLSSFYMSLIDGRTGRIFWEKGPLAGKALSSTSTVELGYKLLSYKVAIDPNKQPLDATFPSIRLGFWGNGQDAWIQIDDVYLMCSKGNAPYPPSQEKYVPSPDKVEPCGPPQCIDFP
jgi:hypothetical protein